MRLITVLVNVDEAVRASTDQDIICLKISQSIIFHSFTGSSLRLDFTLFIIEFVLSENHEPIILSRVLAVAKELASMFAVLILLFQVRKLEGWCYLLGRRTKLVLYWWHIAFTLVNNSHICILSVHASSMVLCKGISTTLLLKVPAFDSWVMAATE